MIPTIFAPIKINLSLHVGAPRADGYHPVDTLCVFPLIGDILSYEPDASTGLDFGGRFGARLAEEGAGSNLISRAFRLLDIAPQGRFFLQKETPIASGVGAGTADGVAAMLLLNDVLELGFSEGQLTRRALGLGADGPVCMAAQIAGGGLIRARGIGERTEHLGRCEPLAITAANPGRAISTAEVFRRFGANSPGALRPAVIERPLDLPSLVHTNRNDLFGPAAAIEPAVAALRDDMRRAPGVLAAGMSGSGATCFAIHASATGAERQARRLRAEGFWAESSFILTG